MIAPSGVTMLGRGVNPLSPKTALPCLVPLRVSELVEGKPFDRSLRGNYAWQGSKSTESEDCITVFGSFESE